MKFNLPNDHFAGWVPCITGHLSFSLFGGGSQFSTYNVPETKQDRGSDAPGRKIVIVQRRLAQDYIIPSTVIYFFKPRIASDFYLLAEAVPAKQPITVGSAGAEKLEVFEDELGALVGEIYVSHKYTNRCADIIRRGQFKKITQECEKFQAEFERSGADRWDAIQSRIKDMVKEIGANDAWVSRWHVIIFRTGEVRFWPSEEFKSLIVKKYGVDYARSYIENVASQVYFFIKDSGHLHYHHNKNRDNIIPASRVALGDDMTWRRETMWALVRAILRQRRKSRISQFSQAEGILAYAEAFQNNLGMHIRCDKEDQVFLRKIIASEYDLNKMRGSLSSRKDELIWELSDSRQSFFTVLGSILSMLAIWVGLDALNEAEERSRYITEFILKFYKHNPDMVIISVTAVALFYSWITKTRIPLFTNLGNWLFAIIDAAMYDVSRFIGDRAALIIESLFLLFLFLCFSIMLAVRLI